MVITYTTISSSELQMLTEDEKNDIVNYLIEAIFEPDPNSSKELIEKERDVQRSNIFGDHKYGYINRPESKLIRAWNNQELSGLCFILPTKSGAMHDLDTDGKLKLIRQKRIDFLNANGVSVEECFTVHSCVNIPHLGQGIWTEMRYRSILEAKKLGYRYSISATPAGVKENIIELVNRKMTKMGAPPPVVDSNSKDYYAYFDCVNIV